MRQASVWPRAMGCEGKVIVEREEFDEAVGAQVAHVRPTKRETRRCPWCRRRCRRFDNGDGRRRWRALDMGQELAYVEADAPRVRCREHGVVVAAVPWARHRARLTRGFDDQGAWLATECSQTAACELMRIAWRSVGSAVSRVEADIDAQVDRLADLRRIGIDEISYKKKHNYLTVVVDHDTGRVVWAAPGADSATLGEFFTKLGPDRCDQISHVSADAARWIAGTVAAYCPQAVQCLDPFHVVGWANEALDQMRRAAWNAAKGRRETTPGGRGATGEAKALARSRWALWKNPDNLTENQQAKLDWIAKTNPVLHRAWSLKEGLRTVFATTGDEAIEALQRWLAWAQRCDIRLFIDLGEKIKRHRETIEATLVHDLSNGLVESTNTKTRLIMRRAFGFHSPEALISLTMLTLGRYKPTLPGREAA